MKCVAVVCVMKCVMKCVAEEGEDVQQLQHNAEEAAVYI